MSFKKRLRYIFKKVTTADIDQAVADALPDGDWKHVLWLCNRHLRSNPQAVPVVLTRARCYQALNRLEDHRKEVALAYALDDTFVPAIYQQAAVWVEDKQTEEALGVIALIKDHPMVKDGVNSLLGTLCARRAKAELATEYQLRTWMANFDHIRYANSYLFGLTYADVDELRMASEHQFWAQTLLPYNLPKAEDRQQILNEVENKLGPSIRLKIDERPIKERKLRIGYWGGDFKEHSVRYFFRPLLEGHDRNSVEIFIYDDNFMHAFPDVHTEFIRKKSDHFFTTAMLSDDAVATLIHSHRLDVLVDLQGHTSANRMHVWQARLATIQMTGLAYPPTTGLNSIDYKFVDVHMVSDGSERYYTECQLVFPTSFWCFDPKEEAPYTPIPPYHERGYITLGCWGNAAKISKSLMRAWARILQQSPNTRLQVVSHTFGDPVTEGAFTKDMVEAGIPLDRMDCRPAFGLDELWIRYQEVDLMLDTHPFNGGTTSCWSIYAGVPVLTIAGKSLPSRMGKSMMTNLGFPEFVVTDFDAYVEAAVKITHQPSLLDQFRTVARQRFKASSLGNGSKFAADFEHLCRVRLLEPDSASLANAPSPNTPPLPLEEMLRRARMVGYHGQLDACDRILAACHRHYGDDVRIIDFEIEAMLSRNAFSELLERCRHVKNQSAYMLHAQALTAIIQSDPDRAKYFASKVCESDPGQSLHAVGGALNFRHQQLLWQAWLKVQQDHEDPASLSARLNSSNVLPQQSVHKFLFIVVGRDLEKCRHRADQLKQFFANQSHLIEFRICLYWDRVQTLNTLLTNTNEPFEIVILMRDHVDIVDTEFIQRIAQSLTAADVISPAGALRWIQKEWAQDLPEYKYWGLMRRSLMNETFVELYFSGTGTDAFIPDAQVLDGQLLAFSLNRVRGFLLDDCLDEAGYWAEEEWVNRLFENNRQLAIHRGLGVLLHPTSDFSNLHTSAGQQFLLKRLNLDPLSIPHENYDIQTIQTRSSHEGMKISTHYLVNNLTHDLAPPPIDSIRLS